MKKNLVEKYDRLWYSMTLYLTIMVALVAALYIVFCLLAASGIELGSVWVLHSTLLAISGIIVLYSVVYFVVLAKMKANKTVSAAMDNEMLRIVGWKAASIGFYVFLCGLVFLALLADCISAVAIIHIVRIILFAGVLSMLIAWLRYNRDIKS